MVAFLFSYIFAGFVLKANENQYLFSNFIPLSFRNSIDHLFLHKCLIEYNLWCFLIHISKLKNEMRGERDHGDRVHYNVFFFSDQMDDESIDENIIWFDTVLYLRSLQKLCIVHIQLVKTIRWIRCNITMENRKVLWYRFFFFFFQL